MALPSIEKTWQFNVNQNISGTAGETMMDTLLLGIKNSLKGFGTNPWTVWGSSNGSTTSSSDLWSGIGDIVHAAGAHSWIVLTNVNGWQICFDCYHPTANVTRLVVSFEGLFSGGTTTNRPTAIDELIPSLGTTPWLASGDASVILHAMQSTDGYNTRIFYCKSGSPITFFAFEKVKNPNVSVDPVFLCNIYDASFTTIATRYQYFNDNTSSYAKINGDLVYFYLTSEAFGTATLGENLTFADDDITAWCISPMGLVSTTGKHRGRKGQLYDMWWGSDSATVRAGATYPNDGSKAFAQFYNIIFPWDGSVPLLG